MVVTVLPRLYVLYANSAVHLTQRVRNKKRAKKKAKKLNNDAKKVSDKRTKRITTTSTKMYI